MDAKEEIVEEIEDLSTESEKQKEMPNEDSKTEALVIDPIIKDEVVPEEVSKSLDDKEDLKEENKPDENNQNSIDENKEVDLQDLPKKSKAPILVLLSILLALDIAALVIYIIGVEKVISFIK